ncbi:Hypothetical protein SMAX5B_020748 [Scophthalmus maximus]|uniref:Uncharacterized protein n=1 Tax=Scophthalmus maximus TaxID=52904 RepID=A0A2U9CQG0_SCOMX|nr:Hypothetical protein SMAX5B_020748 [Scophthalmus maximus]KAF0032616.1 hypothetical protein F2P81_014906 [Scophthalmus maximus]
MPSLLQATAMSAIAWQQALPEALVSSQVETDKALKQSVWLWRFNDGTGKLRGKANLDKHYTKYKSELAVKQLSQCFGTCHEKIGAREGTTIKTVSFFPFQTAFPDLNAERQPKLLRNFRKKVRKRLTA